MINTLSTVNKYKIRKVKAAEESDLQIKLTDIVDEAVLVVKPLTNGAIVNSTKKIEIQTHKECGKKYEK